MEALKNECPTDILIDLKDEHELLPVLKNREEVKYLNNVESKINLNDKKDVVYDKNCPTAVLIDVPFATNSYLNESYMHDDTEDLCNKEKIQCLIPELENEELKGKTKGSSNSDLHNCSEAGDSPNSLSNLSEMIDKVARLHWKPPSPQSMSHISKEASKVIKSLNSAIFEEDSLLSEEILPIPLNFDDFDLDDGDKLASSDFSNNSEHEILSSEFSNSIINQNKTNSDIAKEKSCNTSKTDVVFKNKSPKKIKSTFGQPLNEKNINECGKNSRKLCSSETQTDSLNDSVFSPSDENDVFIPKTQISPEDKENIPEMNNEIIVPRGIKSSKTAPKSLSRIRPKFDHPNTLKNCSNIYQGATTKNSSFNKNANTPLKKMGPPEKSKEIQPHAEKLPRSSSVDYQRAASRISRSNTFQFQSTKELMSSVRRQSSVIKDDSQFKSLSSDLKKQISNVKTPSRRYSICTPLKDVKLSMTPATSRNYQNGSVPRYLSESVRAPRLSFSKSWQQPVNNSHTSMKGLMQRNSMCKLVPPSTPNVISGITYSSKKKQPFSQSMSAVSFPSGKNAMSTSSKVRFSSKLSLPSPLPPEQERKLARALFPSIPGK